MATKQLIIVVDGTANLRSHWDNIVENYLKKIIRNFCGNDSRGQEGPSSGAMTTGLGMVVYSAHGRAFTPSLLEPNAWTTDADTFLNWLTSFKFSNSKAKQTAMAEGLADALLMFPQFHNGIQGQDSYLTAEKHCILVAASKPFCKPTLVRLPEMKHVGGNNLVISSTNVETCIADAKDVAKILSQCSVSLSIISPYHISELEEIYKEGDPNATEANRTTGDAGNPQFLVLLTNKISEALTAINETETSLAMDIDFDLDLPVEDLLYLQQLLSSPPRDQQSAPEEINSEIQSAEAMTTLQSQPAFQERPHAPQAVLSSVLPNMQASSQSFTSQENVGTIMESNASQPVASQNTCPVRPAAPTTSRPQDQGGFIQPRQMTRFKAEVGESSGRNNRNRKKATTVSRFRQLGLVRATNAVRNLSDFPMGSQGLQRSSTPSIFNPGTPSRAQNTVNNFSSSIPQLAVTGSMCAQNTLNNSSASPASGVYWNPDTPQLAVPHSMAAPNVLNYSSASPASGVFGNPNTVQLARPEPVYVQNAVSKFSSASPGSGVFKTPNTLQLEGLQSMCAQNTVNHFSFASPARGVFGNPDNPELTGPESMYVQNTVNNFSSVSPASGVFGNPNTPQLEVPQSMCAQNTLNNSCASPASGVFGNPNTPQLAGPQYMYTQNTLNNSSASPASGVSGNPNTPQLAGPQHMYKQNTLNDNSSASPSSGVFENPNTPQLEGLQSMCAQNTLNIFSFASPVSGVARNPNTPQLDGPDSMCFQNLANNFSSASPGSGVLGYPSTPHLARPQSMCAQNTVNNFSYASPSSGVFRNPNIPQHVRPQDNGYPIVWKGSLHAPWNGQLASIGRLVAYRRATTRAMITHDWPPTVYVDRFLSHQVYTNFIFQIRDEYLILEALDKHPMFEELKRDKICSIVKLPSQIMVLSPSEKDMHFIATIYPKNYSPLRPYMSSPEEQPQVEEHSGQNFAQENAVEDVK